MQYNWAHDVLSNYNYRGQKVAVKELIKDSSVAAQNFLGEAKVMTWVYFYLWPIVTDSTFTKVLATREPCTTAGPCDWGRKGKRCEKQDLLGHRVHGEREFAGVLAVEGEAVCHQKGPNWLCLWHRLWYGLPREQVNLKCYGRKDTFPFWKKDKTNSSYPDLGCWE